MSKQTTSLKYSTVRSLNHICIYIFLHLYCSYVERCRLKRELHAELDEAPAYIRTTYTPPLLNAGYENKWETVYKQKTGFVEECRSRQLLQLDIV